MVLSRTANCTRQAIRRNATMKKLFSAEASSVGGRSGSVSTPDELLNFELGNPLEKGIETRGPNPELFFAAAYAAC